MALFRSATGNAEQVAKILALLTSAAMIVLPIPAIPETRGLVVPSPDTGEAVVEYRGSYALLIGAPSDAKDDKQVTHIANSGVAGGR